MVSAIFNLLLSGVRCCHFGRRVLRCPVSVGKALCSVNHGSGEGSLAEGVVGRSKHTMCFVVTDTAGVQRCSVSQDVLQDVFARPQLVLLD